MLMKAHLESTMNDVKFISGFPGAHHLRILTVDSRDELRRILAQLVHLVLARIKIALPRSLVRIHKIKRMV